MRWTSTASLEERVEAAVDEVVADVRASLRGAVPDLAVVFVSPHHRDSFERVPGLLRKALGGGLLVGCSAGGVIGGGSEIEDRAAISVTAAELPGVELVPFHLSAAGLPASNAPAADWERSLGVRAGGRPHFLLLPDPLSADAEQLLSGLDRTFPHGRKIGGLASGGRSGEANALYLGAGTYAAGVVGVAMQGNLRVDTVVSQGCRPIGEPMFVTRAERNMALELDGRPPLDALRDVYAGLSDADRDLFRHSLFVGLVMAADRQRYSQGDFLIRNIVGLQETSGALAIAAPVRESGVIQFHLRDAETSAADLDQMLTAYARESATVDAPPSGSLLFSCLGRGARLYGRPDHDTDAFRKHFGEVPLGGFFCNGEIGQVGGRTFVHGYTSAFGIFRPAASA